MSSKFFRRSSLQNKFRIIANHFVMKYGRGNRIGNILIRGNDLKKKVKDCHIKGFATCFPLGNIFKQQDTG